MYRVQFPTGTAGVEQRRDEELREPVVGGGIVKKEKTDTHVTTSCFLSALESSSKIDA